MLPRTFADCDRRTGADPKRQRRAHNRPRPVTVRDDADAGLLRIGHFLVDIGPLKTSREFRLLFVARALSTLTFGILTVAVNWQVFALTRSSLQVGFASFCLAASTTAALLLGGNLADRYDRRRLMLISRA